jgi:hypothetical protein
LNETGGSKFQACVFLRLSIFLHSTLLGLFSLGSAFFLSAFFRANSYLSGYIYTWLSLLCLINNRSRQIAPFNPNPLEFWRLGTCANPARDRASPTSRSHPCISSLSSIEFSTPARMSSSQSRSGGERMIHQDYIARIRYSNALPPPPNPPKLLDIPNTGLASGQYTAPGFASRLAREQPLNIEADAELGMPLDLVGMPGVFDGDESCP